MIRKKTLVVVILFLLLLAAAFYLQKNPLPDTASVTPSPTARVKALGGITAQDIVSLELVQNQDDSLLVERVGQGEWNVRIGDETRSSASPGKIEQARDELASALVIATLPGDYSLEAIGLAQPEMVINLTTSAGQTYVIGIGGETPTRNGTYIKVNDSAPVAVDSMVIDTAYNLLVEAAASPDSTEAQETTVP